jgi:hypothetical protein
MVQGGLMHKHNIIETLQLISSPSRQFEYEKSVPIAQVPSELFCMWFDDFYHPNSADFIASFNATELNDLSLFNASFDKLGENVQTNNGVVGLQNDINWLAIQMNAGKLLAKHRW